MEDFYAMCHRDKKPMLIISTCGLTLPGPVKRRDRYLWKDGAIVHRTWRLEQPHMMAVYRANFNAVDRLNKETFGHASLCEAIGTKSWWKKVWFGLLAMSTSNAYHAFVRPWTSQGETMDRFEFIVSVANQLLTNKWLAAETAGPSRTLGVHTHQVYTRDQTRLCSVCRKRRVHW